MLLRLLLKRTLCAGYMQAFIRAKMKVKPCKCRGVSIRRGNLVLLYWYNIIKVIPSIGEKPVKFSNSTFSDWLLSLQNSLLRRSIPLIRPPCMINYKLWCLQFGLLTGKWGFWLYEVAISGGGEIWENDKYGRSEMACGAMLSKSCIGKEW